MLACLERVHHSHLTSNLEGALSRGQAEGAVRPNRHPGGTEQPPAARRQGRRDAGPIVGAQPQPIYMERAEMAYAMDSGASTPVLAGEVELSVNVYIVYEIA